MDKQTAMLHAARGVQGDQTSLLNAIRAALLGDGYRTYAGNPNTVITPENRGEYCFDTTNGVMYRALGTANTGWAAVGTAGLMMDELQSLDISARVEMFDDFIGDVLASNWGNATKGSDGATVDFAHLTGVNGMIQGTTGAGAGANMATNGIQLHSALQWKANQGGLVFETRLKISAITTVSLFAGLTDQIATLEAPIISAGSANTITTNAADAVGFMFDTGMTAANFWGVGVANDVDATAANLTTAPVADTFITLRVELSAAGVATFKINGTVAGTASAAVTATVALTPVVTIFSKAASSLTCQIDYIKVSALRA